MSQEGTKKMVSAYIKRARPKRFLTSFYRTPQENFHRSKSVVIDIERGGEDVAIAVTDLTAGGRNVEATEFTSKEFEPPVFKQRGTINSVDLMERSPGVHPFSDPNYQMHAVTRAFSKFTMLEDTIRRAIELMASETFQNGVVSLRDENGNTVYKIDYKPKSSHFPTASTAWGASGYDPEQDLGSLTETVRNDGLEDPKRAIMGMAAWKAFKSHPEVQKQLDNRRMEVGRLVRPELRASGATFRGWFAIDHYELEIWTYNGGYKDPQTGAFRYFIDPENVVVLPEEGRYDLTFGAVPKIVEIDPRVRIAVPARIANPQGGMDMFTDAWASTDGTVLNCQVAARPLTIPTAIDTFGCLRTGASST